MLLVRISTALSGPRLGTISPRSVENFNKPGVPACCCGSGPPTRGRGTGPGGRARQWHSPFGGWAAVGHRSTQSPPMFLSIALGAANNSLGRFGETDLNGFDRLR